MIVPNKVRVKIIKPIRKQSRMSVGYVWVLKKKGHRMMRESLINSFVHASVLARWA